VLTSRAVAREPESGEVARRPRADARPEEQPPVVVAIGASAGGLKALQAFFSAVPADSGLAFVVVVHRREGQIDLLPDILHRSSGLEAVVADDGTPLLPDRIHFRRPGDGATIEDDRLETGDRSDRAISPARWVGSAQSGLRSSSRLARTASSS